MASNESSSIPSVNMDLMNSGATFGPSSRETATIHSRTDYTELGQNNPHPDNQLHSMNASFVNIHPTNEEEQRPRALNRPGLCSSDYLPSGELYDNLNVHPHSGTTAQSTVEDSRNTRSQDQVHADAGDECSWSSTQHDTAQASACSTAAASTTSIQDERPDRQRPEPIPSQHTNPQASPSIDSEPFRHLHRQEDSICGGHTGTPQTPKVEETPIIYKSNSRIGNMVIQGADIKGTITIPGNRSQINIDIANTNTVQIGNNNMMIVHQQASGGNIVTVNQRVEAKPKKRVTLEVPRRGIEQYDMEIIAEHIGTDWQRLGRRLGFNRGELDIISHDHTLAGGLQEVIYQMLLQWQSKCGPEATIKLMVKHLVDIKRADIAVKFKAKK